MAAHPCRREFFICLHRRFSTPPPLWATLHFLTFWLRLSDAPLPPKRKRKNSLCSPENGCKSKEYSGEGQELAGLAAQLWWVSQCWACASLGFKLFLYHVVLHRLTVLLGKGFTKVPEPANNCGRSLMGLKTDPPSAGDFCWH